MNKIYYYYIRFPQNVKEFKALVNRYETITFEEVDSAWYINGLITARNLTGFGRMETCSLCNSVSYNCSRCIYVYDTGCIHSRDHVSTYSKIQLSSNSVELFTAFRERAKYLKKRYFKYFIDNGRS